MSRPHNKPAIKRDSELNTIEWRDLQQLHPVEIIYNVLLSLPLLIMSFYAVWQGWWLVALTASFFFFTAALRQAHDCYHNTLGIGKRATTFMLFLLSITMLCSTHAIRQTHLNHHRDPLGEDDVEGNWARLPWYQAILCGGLFSVAIQWFGLTHGDRHKRALVVIDFMLILSVIVFVVTTRHPVLMYHVGVMLIANTMVGFFAVWSVHHDCGDEVYARSERRPIINKLTFNLLFHVEHHLFPAVPTNHLPKLAQRLDINLPLWTQHTVFPRSAVKPIHKTKMTLLKTKLKEYLPVCPYSS